jgi:alkylated DNA repair dioxygenase AlkB
MNTAMQCSLFGGGPATFDKAFVGLRHRPLTSGAWVDHVPGWLDGHQSLFDDLAEQAQWQQQHRRMYERTVAVPRLVASAPDRSSSGTLLRQMSRALSVRYQLALTRISLAWYRDGRDSVAMHGDKLGTLTHDTVIATVSVGEPRRFLMKPVAGGDSIGFDLGWGDLLVMGGTAQHTWLHGVPKLSYAGPRISIIFRPFVLDARR